MFPVHLQRARSTMTRWTTSAAWLDQLPPDLGAQRRLLQRLLDWCEHDDDVRWLTVGCSLERGNADWMSDLDVAIGVREEHFEETLVRVRRALRDLGDLVESYDYLMPLSFPLRRFFAQYRDRTQVDLTVGFAPVVNLPRSVVLYDPEGAVHIVGDDGPRPESRRGPGLGLPGVGSVGQRREVRPAVVVLGSTGPAPRSSRQPVPLMGACRARTPGPLWAHGARRRWSKDAACHRQVHRPAEPGRGARRRPPSCRDPQRPSNRAEQP